MIKRSVVLLVVLVMTTNIVQASLFDDIMQKISPHKVSIIEISTSITHPDDEFKGFMDMMYLLNTPQALQNLNVEMDNYNTHSVKVWVTKNPWCKCNMPFYVIKNHGVASKYDQWGQDKTDKQVVLTYNQIMKMYPYFIDGKIDFFDRWQLYAIYKMG